MICDIAVNALIKSSCNGGRRSSFEDDSAVLSSDFVIIRCPVTFKSPMRERAVGKKFSAINNDVSINIMNFSFYPR